MGSWISFYAKKGIDLHQDLRAFESSLIQEGYIESGTSQEYKRLYANLAKEAVPHLTIPDSISLACIIAHENLRFINDSSNNELDFFAQLEAKSKSTTTSQWCLIVSELITEKPFDLEVVKSYLQLNLMVLAIKPQFNPIHLE